jgi:hypothetical protein
MSPSYTKKSIWLTVVFYFRRRWWPRPDLPHHLCGLGQCCNDVICPPSDTFSVIPISRLESHCLTSLLVCVAFSIGMERTIVDSTEERGFWRYVILLMRDMLLRFCCYFIFWNAVLTWTECVRSMQVKTRFLGGSHHEEEVWVSVYVIQTSVRRVTSVCVFHPT